MYSRRSHLSMSAQSHTSALQSMKRPAPGWSLNSLVHTSGDDVDDMVTCFLLETATGPGGEFDEHGFVMVLNKHSCLVHHSKADGTDEKHIEGGKEAQGVHLRDPMTDAWKNIIESSSPETNLFENYSFSDASSFAEDAELRM